MLRVLLFFSVIGVFALENGFAMDAELFPLSESPSKKRKIDFPDHTTPPKKPKVGTVPIFSPLVKYSPKTAERAYWLEARKKFALEEYRDFSNQFVDQLVQKKAPSLKNKRKNPVSSPEARNILKKLPQNFWSRSIHFDGKTVYQADFLFDPEAEFWTKDGLKTNLELMKSGHAPIVCNDNDDYVSLVLHHSTQNDMGTAETPIVEMTDIGHMSRNARMILEVDPKTSKLRIVHCNLTKEEALKLCEPHQFIVTNVLHFREGKSLIDREEFDSWRNKYWPHRAEEIEKGNFVGKENLPAFVTPIEFFSSPVKEKLPFGSTSKIKRKLSFSPSTSPVKKRKLGS